MPNITDELSIEANRVDPEQTAPIGSVWSGSTLFAIEASLTFQQMWIADDFCCHSRMKGLILFVIFSFHGSICDWCYSSDHVCYTDPQLAAAVQHVLSDVEEVSSQPSLGTLWYTTEYEGDMGLGGATDSRQDDVF